MVSEWEGAAEPACEIVRRTHTNRMITDQPANDAVVNHLRELLVRHGLRPMVVFLNGLSTFRFSAVMRFDKGMLQTVCYYDREDPRPDALPAVPEEASYCRFVKARREIFSVPDSKLESCLSGHPARDAVRAYCGAPLYGAEGNVMGSICHFNIDPVRITVRDGELLTAAADLLMKHHARVLRSR